MRYTKRSCRLIQEERAWKREESQEEKNHLLSCVSCAVFSNQVVELDALIRNAMATEVIVPTGFADRVHAKITEKEQPRFLERMFYSRIVQWTLVGLGITLALYRILALLAGFIIQT